MALNPNAIGLAALRRLSSSGVIAAVRGSDTLLDCKPGHRDIGLKRPF